MKPGGVVIVLAGVWLACQVFSGNALERLGVLSASAGSGGTAPSAAIGPAAPSTDTTTRWA